MGLIHDARIGEVKKLYINRKLSAPEIAARLHVSLDAVYYFLRKHTIPRRDAAEQNRLRFIRKRPSFHPKEKLSPNDEELKNAGIVLYWAEGANAPANQIVDFANSNPAMIILFVKFLRTICNVSERRLRAYLYCYSNQNPKQLIQLWSRVTRIPSRQFTKPYVRNDYRPEKSNRMRYGLLHIRYSDKKLLRQLQEWRDEFLKAMRVDTQAVNGIGL